MKRIAILVMGLLIGAMPACATENCHDCAEHTTGSETETTEHETHVHTSSTSETDDETETETDTHSGSESDTHGSDATTEGTTGGPSEWSAMDYCDCMLVACHDYYHEHWGEDHDASLAACLDEAGAVPEAGMPVSEGNFFECRAHHCDAAYSEPQRCTEAAGMGMCQ